MTTPTVDQAPEGAVEPTTGPATAKVGQTGPQSPPKAAQTPDAPVPSNDGRYASEEVQKELAAGVRAAREAGFSRTKLEELTTLTPANLWRIEQGRAHKHEVGQLREVLVRIASGALTPPPKPGKVNQRDAELRAILGEADGQVTKAQLLDVVRRAREVLDAA